MEKMLGRSDGDMKDQFYNARDLERATNCSYSDITRYPGRIIISTPDCSRGLVPDAIPLWYFSESLGLVSVGLMSNYNINILYYNFVREIVLPPCELESVLSCVYTDIPAEITVSDKVGYVSK